LTHLPRSHPLHPALLRQFDRMAAEARTESTLEQARAALAHGLVQAIEDRPWEAAHAFAEAVRAFAAVGDDRNACLQGIDAGMMFLALGRWDEAEAMLRRCRADAIRLRLGRATALPAL